ncbi:phage head morphogenesis protein [Falcatimonas sp. MSJ-15]|uniref:phage minor head protein n=1 Tax=Falcatimonas sp. MSJ-15 TaxID=2841515 RepID=UPI001C10AEC0|nr:phage minor head protein [Falcatimonas sp. MSJ-15]MBU5470138.1 phage head morphogenesis protein [Falcatimonas sp. MSJ-15]
MNKREKEVLEETLKNEKKVLKELDKVYAEALTEIDDKISQLLARDDGNMQNVIYQVEYQKALKQQIESAIDTLHSKEFTSVSEYLTDCYNTGFIGTMYNLHGQNIPLMIPIDQEQVVQAITKDTKLSESLYNRLGKDIKTLKKQIASELSVGIATAQSYADIHRNIATVAGISKNKAMRIARTEGHRIQQTASYDAQKKAKEKGADIVKQWSAALDGRTRESHRRVDGEIRELDEPFSNGLMIPGDHEAPASEVVNCRCALLQRARWALDESELETLRKRASFHGLLVDDSKKFGHEKAIDFSDFKAKYLKASHEENAKEAFKKKYGITEKDEKAIYDYVSFKSYVVNDKLRRKQPLTHDEERFTMELNNALDKMPTYSGNLQRSLLLRDEKAVQDFLKEYKIGKTIAYKEFLSTTKGDTYNPDGQIQIFIQDAKNGKDISVFNEQEQEVLYKNDLEFNVIYMTENEGKYYILLEESK